LDAVYFSDISASFRSDRKIARATGTVTEHRNGQQVACTSCHVHNSIAASCTGCHGYPPSDTAAVKYPAVPRSPFTFVPSPDPDADASSNTTDSHPRHGGSKSGQAPNSYSVYSFGCGVCHYGSAGGVDPSLNHHLNGLVSVVLEGVYGRSPNGPGGAYDNQNYYNHRLGYPPGRTGQLDNTAGANGWGGASSPTAGWDNCTNVYCHSAGRAPSSMGDNDYRRPQWNTGAIGCNGCHGTGTDNSTFAYGMPDYATTPATPNTHAPHVIANRYECSVCHAGTVTGTGAARTILGGNPTLHVNRVREVSFGGGASGTYDNNPRSCSVNCHGAGTPV
jgi:predicted CxxxxCH...CXXCH cytochrome family protein